MDFKVLCTHPEPRVGAARLFRHCVALLECNASAHGGLSYPEVCDTCGFVRTANVHHGQVEHSPWGPPHEDLSTLTAPITAELARDVAGFFQACFGFDVSPLYVAGLATSVCWELQWGRRWNSVLDPSLPQIARGYEPPGLEGEDEDYLQAWQDWTARPPTQD